MAGNFSYIPAGIASFGIFLVAHMALAQTYSTGAQNIPSPVSSPRTLLELPGSPKATLLMPTAPIVPALPPNAAPLPANTLPPTQPTATLAPAATGHTLPGVNTTIPISTAPVAIPAVTTLSIHTPSMPAATPFATSIIGSAPIQNKKSLSLFVPVHLAEESLMFSKNDMEILKPFVEAYDNIHEQRNDTLAGEKDDLRSLMQSLKSHDDGTADTKPPPLKNLYLGSILYYSPSHWSVWINGKKLAYNHNQPANEFFVSELSRKEIVLVWRPQSLADAAVLWQQMTQNGKQPLQNIAVDSNRGIITLHMHTNQTFLTKSLALHEGLILPGPPTAPAVANMPQDKTSGIAASAPSASQMLTNPLPSIPMFTEGKHP